MRNVRRFSWRRALHEPRVLSSKNRDSAWRNSIMMQLSATPLLASVTVLIWAASGIAAGAQQHSFPSGTIRLVAPNSASTPPDIISRILAKELSEAEGWRVIVENRPGGVSTIAAHDVLTQPADGYSLLAMSVPSTAAP